MSARTRGLVIAGLQLAIVCSLAGKYCVDRLVRPRVWVRAVGYDPEALIRGRYVNLGIVVEARAVKPYQAVRLAVEDGRLVAAPAPHSNVRLVPPTSRALGPLVGPVAFYLPPDVPDPTLRKAGEELWAEVTVPRQGPPRPIRLAVKRNGRLETLEY